MRISKWIAAALAAAFLFLVLGTLLPRPLFGRLPAGEATRSILVVSNPIHTDILLPLDGDVALRFAPLAEAGLPMAHPSARWLAFGWGSRAFYVETPTWSELKPGPLIRALTLDLSVMHVTVIGDVAISREGVVEYRLDDPAFARLVAFVDASFARAEGNFVPMPGAAYGPDDAFFEANGSFNALAGCNTWTARALREAGLTTGWWNPLPQSLGWSMALYN